MAIIDLFTIFQKTNTTTDILSWALTLVQDENRKLQRRVDELEEALTEERSKNDVRNQTSGPDDLTSWLVRDPKRIG